MSKEIKSIHAYHVKMDEDKGIVEHLVAVMGNVDEGLDVVHPGAFTKTIAENKGKIRVVDLHNDDSILRVLGRPVDLREIGRNQLPPEVIKNYPEATGGLLATTQYNLKTAAGHDAFYHILEGDIDEYSFRYEVKKSDPGRAVFKGQERTTRNLREVKLFEYSPVIWGMNPATATISAKSEMDKEKAGADYPWEECISDMMEEYGDEDIASHVSNVIRAVAQGKDIKGKVKDMLPKINDLLEIKPKAVEKALPVTEAVKDTSADDEAADILSVLKAELIGFDPQAAEDRVEELLAKL